MSWFIRVFLLFVTFYKLFVYDCIVKILIKSQIDLEDTQVAANNSARSSLRSSSVTMEEWFIWGNYVCHYGGTHLDFYSTHDMSP